MTKVPLPAAIKSPFINFAGNIVASVRVSIRVQWPKCLMDTQLGRLSGASEKWSRANGIYSCEYSLWLTLSWLMHSGKRVQANKMYSKIQSIHFQHQRSSLSWRGRCIQCVVVKNTARSTQTTGTGNGARGKNGEGYWRRRRQEIEEKEINAQR